MIAVIVILFYFHLYNIFDYPSIAIYHKQMHSILYFMILLYLKILNNYLFGLPGILYISVLFLLFVQIYLKEEILSGQNVRCFYSLILRLSQIAFSTNLFKDIFLDFAKKLACL